MRMLAHRGVTHFVVSDELKRQMCAEAQKRARNLGDDGEFNPEDPIYFRGRRILEQSDLEHLPFIHDNYGQPKVQSAEWPPEWAAPTGTNS